MGPRRPPCACCDSTLAAAGSPASGHIISNDLRRSILARGRRTAMFPIIWVALLTLVPLMADASGRSLRSNRRDMSDG
jgi:hypothetical protein